MKLFINPVKARVIFATPPPPLSFLSDPAVANRSTSFNSRGVAVKFRRVRGGVDIVIVTIDLSSIKYYTVLRSLEL